MSRSRTATGVRWLALLIAVGAWWLTLAPTALGGPGTFIIVSGHSMEPMLHSGDLVVAHTQSTYAVGDLVVFTHVSGHVIHRIISGDGSGWQTQGDNKPLPDPWTIDSSHIAGKFWFHVPGVGGVMSWAVANWWASSAILALVVAASYLPRQRKRVPEIVRTALVTAIREPRTIGESRDERIMLWASSASTAAALLAFLWVVGVRPDTLAPWFLAGFTLLGCSTLTAVLMLRVFEGRGISEPNRSLRVLAGRLYSVDTFPDVEPGTHVASAAALRRIAEPHRLPVLHRKRDDGVHEFVVVTWKSGTYRWLVAPHGRRAHPEAAVSRRG